MANIFTEAKFNFRLYSNNFNSFKIIEKLLNKNSIQKHKIKENIQMNDLENNKFITIKDDLKEKCIDKCNFQNDINKYGDNKENININKEDKFSSDDKRIKKLSFFDFFLNNLYCCFKGKKNQKIIHSCNQIVYNYASIDEIIKNQILMENLMKDYKWNDPRLNNIENNNLFFN